jgi:S1-C subfamily serine protease
LDNDPLVSNQAFNSVNKVYTLSFFYSLIFLVYSVFMFSCHSEQTSTPLVTNGFLDFGDQAVFMIQGEEAQGNEPPARCTASLIRSDVLLTAAHCVKSRRTGQERLIRLASAAGLRSVEIKIHPEYQSERQLDVAMVRLNGPVKNVLPLAFAAKVPQQGDVVKLVGFGGNQYTTTKGIVEGSGVKRMGTTRVAYLDDQFIYSRGLRDAMPPGSSRPTGIDVALAPGDSGGPMLNAEGVIIGVAAVVNSEQDDPRQKLPIIVAHTQITSMIMDFVKKYLEEAPGLGHTHP